MSDDFKIRSDRNRIAYKVSAKSGEISKDDRDGLVTFTVQAEQDSTARFEVLTRPEIDAHPPKDHPEGEDWKWATLESDEEHTFEQDGSHEVVVKVNAHAGMPTSTREVWLKVADVDHPHEVWAEGPDPHVDVPIEPGPKGIPWWVWLIVGGVVVGAGVGILIWQLTQKPVLGEECSDLGDCAATLECDVNDTLTCLGTNEFKDCTAPAHCLSGACDTQKTLCVDPPGLDEACLGNLCGEGLQCNTESLCKKEGGQPCGTHEECLSKHCATADGAGTCAAPPKFGEPCVEGDSCDGDNVTCVADLCRGGMGYSGCSRGKDCFSYYCARSGLCDNPAPGMSECGVDPACPPNMDCDSGVCKLKNGGTCGEHGQCKSGYCDDDTHKCGVIKVRRPCDPGIGCGRAGGLTCVADASGANYRCLYQAGHECRRSSECETGFCGGSPKTCTLEEKSGLGGMCATDADCRAGENLKCSADKKCKLEDGQRCTKDEDCLSDSCTGARRRKKCAAVSLKKFGERCSQGDRCEGDNVECFDGRCRGGDGYVGCAGGQECKTGYCASGTPGRCRVASVGVSCDGRTGCGFNDGLVCAAGEGTSKRRCRYKDGHKCSEDRECATGYCGGNPKQCRPKTVDTKAGLGEACTRTSDCKSGERLVCASVTQATRTKKLCLYEDGKKGCTVDAHCASQFCAKVPNSRIKVCRAAVGGCKTTVDCPAFVWRYTGTPCSGSTCSGWEALDRSLGVVAIEASDDGVYQLNGNGTITKYTGKPCGRSACSGWQKLDNNSKTVAIAAGGGKLYQRHKDGKIWRHTGAPCVGSRCAGWQMLDNKPKTVSIVAGGGGELYQRRSDGTIWRFTGKICKGKVCPGWQMLDNNKKTVAIVAGGDQLYQRHSDGKVWRYLGKACVAGKCPGWQMLDKNAATFAIAADGKLLYQLQKGGKVLRYTGKPCSRVGCPGWQMVSNNPATIAIAAGGGQFYQLHKGGKVWRYTGKACRLGKCLGWQMLDNNPRAKAIRAGKFLYQLHAGR